MDNQADQGMVRLRDHKQMRSIMSMLFVIHILFVLYVKETAKKLRKTVKKIYFLLRICYSVVTIL